jgi:hypothetical protein
VSARTRLTRRERAVVAALADTMAAPEPPLPPVAQTDTVAALEAWVAASPPVNRMGLRGGLAVLGLAPLALGYRRGLVGLDRAARTAALRRLERSRFAPLRTLMRAFTGVVLITYYGDDGVMRLLGYDADANAARGRRLIADEGRVA